MIKEGHYDENMEMADDNKAYLSAPSNAYSGQTVIPEELNMFTHELSHIVTFCRTSVVDNLTYEPSIPVSI